MRAIQSPAHQAFLRYAEIPGADPPLLWLHGYSDRLDTFGYTMEDHAATIVALIDSLGLTACGIVGHSMGRCDRHSCCGGPTGRGLAPCAG